MSAPSAYDQVFYPGHPYEQTHPDRLAVIGSLYGMEPAPISRCRVLELGCGVGGNLVPLAYQWPESEFVGIDLSQVSIERGMQNVAALGLKNIALRHGDIMEVDESYDAFDYIIAHGVYSWVPPCVREKMLSIFAANLKPEGIAYVSYNCYPGWRMADIAREVMRYHTQAVEEAQEKIEQSRAVMDALAEVVAANEVYGAVIRDQAERVRKKADQVLFHDDLASNTTPFYFHQVAEDAARHGLQYLSESTFAFSNVETYPPKKKALLQRIPDRVMREQYLDFIEGRMFRESLFCRAGRLLERRPVRECIAQFHLSAQLTSDPAEFDPTQGKRVMFTTGKGGRLTTDHRLTKAALLHLRECWPEAIPFSELYEAAFRQLEPSPDELPHDREADIERMAEALAEAFSAGLLELHLTPPKLTHRVAERPRASELARLEAMHGALITTLRHGSVHIQDETVRRFIRFVDGTRTVQDLLQDMQATVEPTIPVDRAAVEANLQRMARLGLLLP